MTQTAKSLLDLHDLCTNATVALFVMDEHQHCVYMNPAAERLTGFALAEVQGAPLHDFVHHTRPDGSPYPLAECPIDRAAPANMQEQGTEVFVHKDGTLYPVSFTASPIRRDGRVVGTVIEVQDARGGLEREREREALQRIGMLIVQEFDHEKIVQAVTDEATALTGAQFGAFFYNVRNEAGESYTLYTIAGVPKEAFSRFPLPRNTHLFGPTFRGEGTIRSDDIRLDPRYGRMAPHHGMPAGHLPVRSYLAVGVKSSENEVIGGLFFGHEAPHIFTEEHERIVETLAAQAAIGLNKASLYQEALFAKKRAELEAAEKHRLYEEAARANEAKDQFLATVSHELRTPLTSILGWSHMLTSGKLDGAMAQRAIETIERNARAQAQIVEDLLDISRIVSGKLRLNVQLFSPQPSVEAAVEAVRPAAIAKSLNIQLVLDPLAGPVSGDPERLQQIVWNLMSNAIKFTPKGGRVHVALHRHHSSIHIVVSDNGAGIPQEYLPRIFESFTQVDATSSRKHGGLGLGLAIVKKLVELHGGTVSAFSEGLGQGASFTVVLPVAPLASAQAHAAAPQVAAGAYRAPIDMDQFSLTGAVVLLVEDDDDARNMLAAVLTGAGAIVETANDAESGLLLWEGIRPDMIVSDIGMPGMDGHGFIAEVRRRESAERRAAAPAVALTAYARVQDRMRALTSGFQMHVAKPVEPAELLTVLSTLRSWRGG
ncbi:ATP-binding protein [Pseudoduganella plicata]|uniref:Virulence sensor protein BvgS n=1 Tax=Pseudoduganella plicata TaxID=321984 RepID=A0A4P7BDN0_9BURK|nr:ATP-binding protein [Pseudoduganella plicata]QBQ36172.1 response regulator [Pseudoduganella plicata]GGY77529.1 two-component hybrid sensor and regulator [Pseudoduganella plicata]